MNNFKGFIARKFLQSSDGFGKIKAEIGRSRLSWGNLRKKISAFRIRLDRARRTFFYLFMCVCVGLSCEACQSEEGSACPVKYIKNVERSGFNWGG